MKKDILIPWITAIAFAVVAYLCLTAKGDVLYIAQMRTLFVSGCDFFTECMNKPGGLLQWAGLWFTQLFYDTCLGASALIAIWLLTFYTAKRGFGISNALSPLLIIPLVCLLSSEIDMGYWIYYLKQPGYYFRESLGFLFVALSVLLSGIDIPKTRRCLVPLLVAMCYPLVGFYAPFAALCICIRNVMHRWYPAAATALATGLIVPALMSMRYDTIETADYLTIGFPIFDYASFLSQKRINIFIYASVAMALLPVMQSLFSRLANRGKLSIAAAVVLYALIIGGCYKTIDNYDFNDPNFIAECKAYRAIDDHRWEDALTAIDGVRGEVTRELIMLRNVALFNIGEIGSRMYEYDDTGITPATDDSLHVSTAVTIGPMYYLHHGMTYFAYRWAMESGVEQGFNVAYLKVMVLASIVNGEYNLANKYLNILSKTMFYKEWAEQYKPIIKNPRLINKYPELKKMRLVQGALRNVTESDAGLCEKYIIEKFKLGLKTTSPYVLEMCLAYAMTSKDIKTFWRAFFAYAKYMNGKDMPIHYQEAAYLYGVLEPQTVNTNGMPFDKERIIDRYTSFNQATQRLLSMGMSEEAVGEAVKSEFGNTFWWTYYFNRGSQYY